MKYKAIKEIALKTALGYLEKDPEKNMPKLMNWVDKLAGTGPDSFESQRAAVRAVVEDPTNNMHQLILNLFNDVDRDQLKTFFTNFILNANILGWPIAGGIPQEVQLQHPVGHSAGPHVRLQPALHRLLGGGIRQQAEPEL